MPFTTINGFARSTTSECMSFWAAIYSIRETCPSWTAFLITMRRNGLRSKRARARALIFAVRLLGEHLTETVRRRYDPPYSWVYASPMRRCIRPRIGDDWRRSWREEPAKNPTFSLKNSSGCQTRVDKFCRFLNRSRNRQVSFFGRFDSDARDQRVPGGRLDLCVDRLNPKGPVLIEEAFNPAVIVTKEDELLAAPSNGLVYDSDFIPGRREQTTAKRSKRRILIQVARIKVGTNTQCKFGSKWHQPIDDPRMRALCRLRNRS